MKLTVHLGCISMHSSLLIALKSPPKFSQIRFFKRLHALVNNMFTHYYSRNHSFRGAMTVCQKELLNHQIGPDHCFQDPENLVKKPSSVACREYSFFNLDFF